MRQAYVEPFLVASGVDARLRAEIRSGVAFDAGSSPSGQLVLRVRHPLGCGASLFDWDGSDDDALETAQSSGDHAGDNLADDVLEWPSDWHPTLESDQSMGALRPDLAIAMRDAFLDAFFAESGLSRRRRTEAADMLRIHQESFANGTKALRFMFEFTGEAQWWEWDGSDEGGRVRDDPRRDQWAEHPERPAARPHGLGASVRQPRRTRRLTGALGTAHGQVVYRRLDTVPPPHSS